MAAKLSKMDPRELAALLKSECLHSGTGRLVEFLNSLLRLNVPIEELQLSLIGQLIAGDMSYQDFAKTIKKYDDSAACGLVWTADFVAYRCRTCGISPCMSICADCFHGGNHEGHDFNMFRSLAGGACDCGDSSVMKASGFCTNHSLDKPQRAMSVPKHLTVTADVVIPRLLWRLVQHFRKNYKPIALKFDPVVVQSICPTLNLLDKLSKLGAAMRRVIVDALLQEDIYTELMKVASFDESIQREGCLAYHGAMSSMSPPDFSSLVSPVPDFPALDSKLRHTNFVGELLFWTAVYNFPQEMITFLLSMLPDNTYKEKFTSIFLKHYVRIAMTLKGKTNPNHVVHVSVQLFSNEALASKMVREMGLLHVLCLSGLTLLKPALVTSPLMAVLPYEVCDTDGGIHKVLNCDSKILKDQCYWPIVSDFANILSHQSVAKYFLQDRVLMQLWGQFLTMFMGMNLNKRELGYHVEFEPNSYSTAFAAEIEGCAAPMWQIASHCQDRTTMCHTLSFTRELQAALSNWLEKLNVKDKLNPLHVSFHIPLIRYLSVFLQQGVNHQGMSLSMLLRTASSGLTESLQFIRSPAQLKKLLMFPLQIMAAISEVYCGMWVRNGLQIKCQAMTYLQCHFCASMADLDLYFIQVCVAVLKSSRLSEDEFIKIVLDRFKVMRWVTFDPAQSPFSMDSNQEMAMLEAALTFIATLVSLRTNLGLSSDATLRQEMVTLLCVEDRTYSKLHDKIPDKTGVINTNTQFEKTLKEIADYQVPTSDLGGLQQGKYSPKPEIWENEFDPLHVMFRSMERKEFQLAMDNYTAYLKKAGRYKDKTIPWPPFQPLKAIHKEYLPLRRILNCRMLHAVIYAVLYKAVHSSVISDAALYMSIAIISMALQCISGEGDDQVKKREEPVQDDDPSSWFSDGSILVNLCTELKAVRYQVNVRRVNPYEKEAGAKPHSIPAAGPNQFLVSLMMDGQWVELLNTQGAGGGATTDPNDEWVNILTNMIQTGEPTVEEVPMEVDEAPPAQDRTPDLLNLDEQKTKEDEETNAKRQRKGTPPPEYVTKQLNESMVSLLVKLYAKLSNDEVTYLPPSLPKDEGLPKKTLHGQGPVYIKDILDRVYTSNHRCRELLDTLCRKNQSETEEEQSNQGSPGSIEDRKQRSMEAKQRMIAKLAQQQKQFLASAFSTEEEVDSARDTEADTKLPEYECVICSHVGQTTEANPYGMCVLLQTTKVLGHRSQSSEVATLPLSDKETLRTGKKCYQVEATRWAEATARFDKVSCLSSFCVSWDSAVHVQTCGHYVHIKCMKSFTESIGAHDIQARHLHVNGGEFECPICRQLANAILPCSVPRSATSMSKYTCKELSKLSQQISKRFGVATRQLSLGKTDFECGVFKFVEDIFRQLPMEIRKAARAEEGGPYPYLCSLARANIELHLVKLGGSLVSDGAPDREKKPFLGLLLDIFSCYLGKMPKIPLLRTWQGLVGLHKPSLTDAERSVPLLIQDPITLLFLFIFHLPQPITNDHLICITFALYNLVHVQALTRIACQLSPTDKNAFLRPSERCRQSEVSVLLGHIIQHLEHLRKGWLYADPFELENVCMSVWSPLAIDAFVKQECLPFMRVVAILQHVMFDVPLPVIEKPEAEFTSLLRYLHLSPPPTDGSHIQRFSMHSPQSLQVTQGNPLALVRLWCGEFNCFLLTTFANEKSSRVPQNLLLFSPNFNQPRLIRLPANFSQLFEYYRRQTCRKCNSRPQKPMLCLVCGRLICWASDCCVVFRGSRKFGEGISHAKECGSGAAVYLDVDSSLTILIQGPRICRWASLYLDSHGEEDRGLRRGKPLFLSQQRFDLLEQLWQSSKLKHFCKGWEWHLGGHD